MNIRFWIRAVVAAATVIVFTGMVPVNGQNAQLPVPPQAPPPGDGIPDFNGVWQAPYVPDLARVLGGQPPFTAFGDEKFKNRMGGNDPTGYCQPTGPTRAFHSPFPFQFIQSAGMITALFEIHTTFRRIFTDGREFPKDLDPTWWGYSIGKYEGNTLRVETVGLNEKTWLDTSGHQHSDKLRITEVFEKTGPDAIQWTVTYNDPVFYSKPWSVSLQLKRQKFDIMEMICTENNRDIQHYITTPPKTTPPPKKPK